MSAAAVHFLVLPLHVVQVVAIASSRRPFEATVGYTVRQKRLFRFCAQYASVYFLSIFVSSCIYLSELFLDDEQVEKLHDFEEDCIDDLTRIKEFNKTIATDERIHRTAERSEVISSKLNDLLARESALKSSVRDVESRLETIEQTQNEILTHLRQLLAIPLQPLEEIGRSSTHHPLPTIVESTRSISSEDSIPSTPITPSGAPITTPLKVTTFSISSQLLPHIVFP